MTPHLHREIVPGCYRCDLNLDEIADVESEDATLDELADLAFGPLGAK